MLRRAKSCTAITGVTGLIAGLMAGLMMKGQPFEKRGKQVENAKTLAESLI